MRHLFGIVQRFFESNPSTGQITIPRGKVDANFFFQRGLDESLLDMKVAELDIPRLDCQSFLRCDRCGTRGRRICIVTVYPGLLEKPPDNHT